MGTKSVSEFVDVSLMLPKLIRLWNMTRWELKLRIVFRVGLNWAMLYLHYSGNQQSKEVRLKPELNSDYSEKISIAPSKILLKRCCKDTCGRKNEDWMECNSFESSIFSLCVHSICSIDEKIKMAYYALVIVIFSRGR